MNIPSPSTDYSYAQSERIATLMERAITQQKTIDKLEIDTESFQTEQKQFNKVLLNKIDQIQSELTGRKEYLRGLKVGIAMFWLLMGATVVTLINKFIHFNIGG